MSELPKWWELPPGGVIPEPATSLRNKTGSWRTFRPMINYEKCTNCGLCWLYCPDMAIYEENGRYLINYEYCKGCGLCSEECPFKAINMVREGVT